MQKNVKRLILEGHAKTIYREDDPTFFDRLKYTPDDNNDKKNKNKRKLKGKPKTVFSPSRSSVVVVEEADFEKLMPDVPTQDVSVLTAPTTISSSISNYLLATPSTIPATEIRISTPVTATTVTTTTTPTLLPTTMQQQQLDNSSISEDGAHLTTMTHNNSQISEPMREEDVNSHVPMELSEYENDDIEGELSRIMKSMKRISFSTKYLLISFAKTKVCPICDWLKPRSQVLAKEANVLAFKMELLYSWLDTYFEQQQGNCLEKKEFEKKAHDVKHAICDNIDPISLLSMTQQTH